MRAQGLLLAGWLIFLFSGSSILPAATLEFTVTATDVIMPRTGPAASQFTITSIPVTGTLVLSCGYSGSLPLGKLPICPLTPPVAYSVTAGGTLKGAVAFYPPTGAIPASEPADGLALGGVLLVLLGWIRRGQPWLRLSMLALACLAALPAITSCAGPLNPMPSGTYPYTITAVNSPAAGLGPAYEAHTIIHVTVP